MNNFEFAPVAPSFGELPNNNGDLEGITLEFTPEALGRLVKTLDELEGRLPPDADEKRIFSLGAEVAEQMPDELKRALWTINNPSTNTPFVLARGLPHDELDGIEKTTHRAELLLAAAAYISGGDLWVGPGHREGKHLNYLIPNIKDAGKQLGTGTGLGWHTEDFQLKASPRLIMLAGVRGHPDAATLISTLNLTSLDEGHLLSLTTTHFSMTSDSSYSVPHVEIAPILTRYDNGAYHCRFEPAFMAAADGGELSGSESELVDYMTNQFNGHHKAVTLEAGDLFIFNNRTGPHAVTSFKPAMSPDGSYSYDPKKLRFLVRAMVA
jgi:hypothetical protein